MSSNNEDSEMCPRCKCCDTYWQECSSCGGEGVDGHDCGEDTCCCLDPEDNETCDVCEGEGGWNRCLGSCDENGKHKKELSNENRNLSHL